MALLIDYPDPQGTPGDTIQGAYGWIEHLSIGFSDLTGEAVFWVHRTPEAAATWSDPSAADIPPAAQERYPFGGPVLPSIAEFMADPEFAAAFETIRGKLYGSIKANRFPDAVDVP